jgi:hypothetical protein
VGLSVAGKVPLSALILLALVSSMLVVICAALTAFSVRVEDETLEEPYVLQTIAGLPAIGALLLGFEVRE